MSDDIPDPRAAEQRFAISSQRVGDVHTVRLSGELDLAGADDVTRELQRAESSDARSIVLDLSDLSFIDSTGVRVVLSASARSRANSNRLTLLRGGPAVQRVFELCAVEGLLPFTD